MSAIISALTAANMFRDMSGTAQSAALAQAALQASAQGAQAAMGQAGANMATAGQFQLELTKALIGAALGIPTVPGPGLKNITTAGATISDLVAAGGDAARLQGVAFGLDDDAALRAKARELAFADARAAAEQYAKLAGRELGDVVLVREQVTPAGPVPMAADSTMSTASAVPIAPGTTDVTVTAQVRWSLA